MTITGNGHSFRRIFLVSALFFVALAAISPNHILHDADTLWHVKTGQLILETGQFPRTDPFSFTMEGQPWIAKEWLSQVVLAAAYNIAGWHGITLLAITAYALSFGLLAAALLRRVSPSACYVLVGGAFLLSVFHVLARPHTLAFPLMVVWFAGLTRATDEERTPSLILLPVMTLWANMHGGFTLGLVAGGGFAVEALLRCQRDQRFRLAMRWSAFLGASLVASCLTPYGLDSILMTRKIYGLGEALSYISEWQPTNFRTNWLAALILLAYLFAALLLRPPMNLGRILLIVLMSYMALQAGRNLEIFGFIVPILISSLFRDAEPGRDPFIPGASDRVYYGAIGVLVVLTLAVFASRPISPRSNMMVNAALDSAQAQGLTGRRLFNSYDFGGYLILRGVKTFVDGRAELFGEQFLMDYHRTVSLSNIKAPLETLNRNDIGWTLLSPGTPLVHLLDNHPDWVRHYSDELAVIHVRSDLSAKLPAR